MECAKYYLCLEGEVFEFKCSVGLLFDVVRQICDFKANVDNCDVTSGMVKAPPGSNLLLHAVINIMMITRSGNMGFIRHWSMWRVVVIVAN